MFWDANKGWERADLLSAIATVLEHHGLKPLAAPTVQGFDSVDQFLEVLPKPPPTDFDAQWNAAPLNTPVVDMADEPGDEIDRSENDDPEDWTPDAKPTS